MLAPAGATIEHSNLGTVLELGQIPVEFVGCGLLGDSLRICRSLLS